MLFLKVVKRILSHPLNRNQKWSGFLRFVKWQLSSRLMPFPIVYPFTSRCSLLIQKGLTGATGNLYGGLDEFYDMAFLLHLLREQDCFVDVGANIGSYTVLAAGHVGSRVVSIEPNDRSFQWLQRNTRINAADGRVEAYKIGLGSKKGTIRFTQGGDTINHVALANETNVVEIPIDTLDNVIKDIAPLLLKVDVEGYEHEVFSGARKLLGRESLKAIIVELVSHGNRYGFKDEDVHQSLVGFGFEPCSYDPLKRTLTRKQGFSTQNTIYVRDFDFVLQRVRSAAPVTINGISF